MASIHFPWSNHVDFRYFPLEATLPLFWGQIGIVTVKGLAAFFMTLSQAWRPCTHHYVHVRHLQGARRPPGGAELHQERPRRGQSLFGLFNSGISP